MLALVELSGDPQPVAQAPVATPTATPASAPADDGGSGAPVAGATPTPAPTTAAPGVTPSPSATPGSAATPTGPAPTTGSIASWPSGKSGWTAVLASTESRPEAERKARAAGGSEIGVLKSDDFSSLRKGYWVVFSGQYDERSAAESAAEASRRRRLRAPHRPALTQRTCAWAAPTPGHHGSSRRAAASASGCSATASVAAGGESATSTGISAATESVSASSE